MKTPSFSFDENINLRQYWQRNLRVLAILLGLWFTFSCVLSIFFAKQLNAIKFAGFKLGFWLAQQGSIYVFIILIVIYVWQMNKLDKEFDVDEK
ncbi:MAG: DUF4212 domain-containing protein [Cytophagales bacterium]|nr:DUF4212 domain-containing protein [Bernardetiaceae bacterium]MDW8211642.1 DUF4212 domain-containing protein [Cytophagales bacterium]